MMKKFALGIILCLLTLDAGFCNSAIGVVDLERIMSESQIFLKAHEKFGKKREKFENKLKKEEKRLTTKEEELKKLKKNDPETFLKSQKQFEQELQKLYENLQRKKIVLRESYEKELGAAQERMNDVLRKIAKSKGIAIVFNKKDTFLVEDDMDITQEVIQELSKLEGKS